MRGLTGIDCGSVLRYLPRYLGACVGYLGTWLVPMYPDRYSGRLAQPRQTTAGSLANSKKRSIGLVHELNTHGTLLNYTKLQL